MRTSTVIRVRTSETQKRKVKGVHIRSYAVSCVAVNEEIWLIAARRSPQRPGKERSAPQPPPTLPSRPPLAHRVRTGALCAIGLGALLVPSPRASIFCLLQRTSGMN